MTISGKRSAGRPSTYKSELCQDLISLMEMGALDVQICAKWNISRDTFYRWLREIPEFKEAHDQGMAKCESWWIDKYYQMADGTLEGKHSFNAVMAIMNNKFKWTRGEADKATQINIGNVNVLQNLSRDQLIQNILTDLKESDIIDVGYKQLTTNEEQGRTDQDSGEYSSS